VCLVLTLSPGKVVPAVKGTRRAANVSKFLSPGATFIKTWRLKNVGTCTWTSGYLLVFDHGQSMDPSARAPDPVALLTTVAPGQKIDVTINLVAPPSPGNYQADFYLRSATGVNFGVGPLGRGTFWVKILVLPPTPTNTATAIGYL
jgi:Ig-like domain from next to BRCA1 gene